MYQARFIAVCGQACARHTAVQRRLVRRPPPRWIQAAAGCQHREIADDVHDPCCALRVSVPRASQHCEHAHACAGLRAGCAHPALRSARCHAASNELGTPALAAAAAGLVASPICLWSEFTLKTTGSGLPPGPGGALGAAEGVSYLVRTRSSPYSNYGQLGVAEHA